MEQPYTNRELDQHFREVKEILGEIRTQTTKTNGRVSSLENWRSWMIGGMAVMGAFVIPLALFALTHI